MQCGSEARSPVSRWSTGPKKLQVWTKNKRTLVCDLAPGQARPGTIIRSVSLSPRNSIFSWVICSPFRLWNLDYSYATFCSIGFGVGRGMVCVDRGCPGNCCFILRRQELKGAGTGYKGNTKLLNGSDTSVPPGSALPAISHDIHSCFFSGAWIVVGWIR